jgi:hypothetical protein
MIIKFIFLIFIMYLVFIYNRLQTNKKLNLETYIKHATTVIQNLEQENEALRKDNNNFENQIIENTSSLQRLNDNINEKNNEITILNSNYQEQKNISSNFSTVLVDTEKNLYKQISDLKINYKNDSQDVIDLKKKYAVLQKEHEVLYKFLKLSDYALYEEFLKNI